MLFHFLFRESLQLLYGYLLQLQESSQTYKASYNYSTEHLRFRWGEFYRCSCWWWLGLKMMECVPEKTEPMSYCIGHGEMPVVLTIQRRVWRRMKRRDMFDEINKYRKSIWKKEINLILIFHLIFYEDIYIIINDGSVIFSPAIGIVIVGHKLLILVLWLNEFFILRTNVCVWFMFQLVCPHVWFRGFLCVPNNCAPDWLNWPLFNHYAFGLWLLLREKS